MVPETKETNNSPEMVAFQRFKTIAEKVEAELANEKGSFRIFFITSLRPSATLWNVIASAPWADADLEGSTELLRHRLESHLINTLRPYLNHADCVDKSEKNIGEYLLGFGRIPENSPGLLHRSKKDSNPIGFFKCVYLIRCDPGVF